MTIVEMIKELEACGDISVRAYNTDEGFTYDVVVEEKGWYPDVEWDVEWEVHLSRFSKLALIVKLLSTLESEAISTDHNFFDYYCFDGFQVGIYYPSWTV